MKLIRTLIVILTCIFLNSCIELKEDVAINADGSGQFSTTTDLAQMIDMMEAMGGEEFEKKKDEKVDTLIYLKSLVDTAKKLNASQKAVLRKGDVHVKMDMGKKIFFIRLKCPFANMNELQTLSDAITSGGFDMGKLIDNTMDKNSDDKGGSGGFEKLLSVYNYKAKDGSISRTVNQEKYKKLASDPELADIKEGAGMGIEIAQTSVYKLPRPVKSTGNKKATLSSDKKTVTLKANLMDVFAAPELLAFSIEY
jgi:hypothetical protein